MIGELRGLTTALLEERREIVRELKNVCERVRHVEISLVGLNSLKLDFDMLRRDIDKLNAVRNRMLGALTAFSLVAGLVGSTIVDLIHFLSTVFRS